MSVDGSLLRSARAAAGLSQVSLASAAGVSRQTIGAIEAGLHRPGVDAALAIARAVGSSVEELFGARPQPSAATPVLGNPLPDRSPVLASQVGDRVVYAAATDALALSGWPVANAVLDGELLRVLPGGDLDGLVVVGCDPALAALAAMLPAAGPRHLIALSGSTDTGLAAMRAGMAHGALVHGPSQRLPRSPRGALRLHLARWRVGLATRGRRGRSLAELCQRRARVVQRDAGAASQKAFLAAVAASGSGPLAGPVASGHLEVARRVAHGATAGVTMEPAALHYGLAFEALEEHVAELWIDARWRSHPAVDALGNLLRSQACTTRLGLVSGYDVAHCGAQQIGNL